MFLEQTEAASLILVNAIPQSPASRASLRPTYHHFKLAFQAFYLIGRGYATAGEGREKGPFNVIYRVAKRNATRKREGN